MLAQQQKKRAAIGLRMTNKLLWTRQPYVVLVYGGMCNANHSIGLFIRTKQNRNRFKDIGELLTKVGQNLQIELLKGENYYAI